MEEHQDLYPLAAVYLFEKAADGSLACERIFSLSAQKTPNSQLPQLTSLCFYVKLKNNGIQFGLVLVTYSLVSF